MTRRELYQAFQKEFPLESLKDMPLEKYTRDRYHCHIVFDDGTCECQGCGFTWRK